MTSFGRASTAVIMAVVLAACSTRDGGAAESDGTDGVKQGVGVTQDSITLGVFSDLSGPLKQQGLAATAGNELWAARINAAGGICGRQVKIEKRDHGYAADAAVAAYPEMERSTLAMVQLLGSQISAALKSSLNEDRYSATAASFSSEVLNDQRVLIMGTTYDLEMINVLDYANQKSALPKGSRIGHIYLDGELGANALRGSKHWAEQNGLTLVAEKISATDTDMSGIVKKMQTQEVSLLALSVTPGATASILSAADSFGFKVPLVASNPSFDPVLFDSPAADLLGQLLIGHSLAPIGSDVPAAKELLKAYEAKYDAPPSISVVHGFATGLIWQQVLESACKAGNLTREGVEAAVKEANAVSTDGLTSGTLDFTKLGVPTSRASFILSPDRDVEGGLTIVAENHLADEATSYRAPHEP
ncbi:ABC transporter substrate-binding protein [Nonomuraea wenchangensis]|uniref:ABC transporter substrate-binding protein n=1 Tax=Nonomuraea wenchangensis TaxID=568860 RepID=UPI00384B8500